jgi:hypothetical protein
VSVLIGTRTILYIVGYKVGVLVGLQEISSRSLSCSFLAALQVRGV